MTPGRVTRRQAAAADAAASDASKSEKHRSDGSNISATAGAASAAASCCSENNANAAAAAYCRALKTFQMEEAPELARGHYFASVQREEGGGATGSRLLREVSSLATALPINPGSSVWVRYDPSCFNMLRACISGPEGTPYSTGLFFFDIFLPSSFPAVPPKVVRTVLYCTALYCTVLHCTVLCCTVY